MAQRRPGTWTYGDDGIYVVQIIEIHEKGRAPRWKVRGYFRGNRKGTRAGAKFSDPQAAEALAAVFWGDYVRGVLEAPEAAPVTVSGLVDRFCERTTGKRGRILSPSTTRAYRTQLAGLVEATGPNCPLHHLSRRHVELAVQRDGVAPRTREQYLRAITALCNWGVKKKWLKASPAEEVEVPIAPRRIRPYLKPDSTTIEKFLDACPPSMKVRAALILETGIRPGEAVHARWDWLTATSDGSVLKIPAEDPTTAFLAKGRRARAIPLTRRARHVLEDAKARWPDGDFILHDRDRPIRSDNWVNDVKTGCCRASVTVIDTHGLRRTAAARWLAEGASMEEVSRLLGHSSISVTEQAYAELNHGRLASVMERMDRAAELPTQGPATGRLDRTPETRTLDSPGSIAEHDEGAVGVPMFTSAASLEDVL